MSLLVISPCYFPSTEPAQPMVESARKHGIEVLLFGMGQQMETHAGNIQGPDVVELLKTRREEYACAVDCLDVLFLGGEAELLWKFQTFNAPLVYSAERNVWPPAPKTAKILMDRPGTRKGLNAGAWIGERPYAIECLSEAIRLYRNKPPDPSCGDVDSMQAWMANMRAYGGLEFTLDTESVLFQSMDATSPEEWKIRDGRYHNLVTGTVPPVLHFNGDKSLSGYRDMYRRVYGA